jgi:hypothetical protein
MPFVEEAVAKQERKRTAKDSQLIKKEYIKSAKSFARVSFSIIIYAHEVGNCSSQSDNYKYDRHLHYAN